MYFSLYNVACEPGDVLCSGISDALLEDVILSTGAQEIQIKVNLCFFLQTEPHCYSRIVN